MTNDDIQSIINITQEMTSLAEWNPSIKTLEQIHIELRALYCELTDDLVDEMDQDDWHEFHRNPEYELDEDTESEWESDESDETWQESDEKPQEHNDVTI